MQNKRQLKRYWCGLLFACLVQTPFAHAVLIGLQPDTNTAVTGDSISLDLTVSDLGNFAPDSLGAFDISVGFDPAALSFTGYSLGGYLGDLGLLEAIDASAGVSAGAVNLAEISLLAALQLDALQPGAFTLATLTFDVNSLTPGASTELSIVPGALLANAAGTALQAAAGSPAIIEGGASVPAPGTLLLVLTALFGWRLRRRV